MEMLNVTVNGEEIESLIDPGVTLQKFLHDKLGLTGTKEGCGSGMCGACTVLVEGLAVKSCIILAVQVRRKSVLTIEGLGKGDSLESVDPLQRAFVENGAIQCGYCTPGMIMSAKGLLNENSNPSEEEIRQAISGNLCRCTGYHKIVKAIMRPGKDDSASGGL